MELHILEGKKYYNNFQELDFFRFLKFPALFSVLDRWKKGRQISKPGKNRGLESCSNIFFPLAGLDLAHIENLIYEVLIKKIHKSIVKRSFSNGGVQ